MTGRSEQPLPDVLRHSPVRVVQGTGKLAEIGRLAAEEGGHGVLLVTDPGIVAAGHAERALASLREAGLRVHVFDGARENPTTEHVATGLEVAQRADVDLIVGLGGGSAMDCAKGINLLLTNGGVIGDYWGENRATEPLLPLVAIPTTAGTGSEAQSFALISNPTTHRKMACGDQRLPREGGLRPRVAVLDPLLAVTQPVAVARSAGIDALAHAVETAGCNRRTDLSRQFSRSAWEALTTGYLALDRAPRDLVAWSCVLLGAHLAGCAIEHSMLGAAHACANPLTASFGLTHGRAVGLMLPHVIAFNAADGANPYADLNHDPAALAHTIDEFLRRWNLPRRLTDVGIAREDLPRLATLAAEEWTAKHNPRPVQAEDLLGIYDSAFQ